MAIYNQPHVPYREDALCILVINAWELLLKAKLIKSNGNRLDAVFAYDSERVGSKIRKVLRRNRSGSGMTIGMGRCIELVRQLPDGIDDAVKSNIETLLEIRDNSCHFMHYEDSLSDRVYRIGSASLVNFFKLYRAWFHHKWDGSEFPALPLAFRPVGSSAVHATNRKNTKGLLEFLDARIGASHSDSEYAVAVDVDVGLSKKPGQNEIQVRLTANPAAPEMRLSESDFKARYPLDYAALQRRLKKQFPGIKFNKHFNKLMKELQCDPNLCHTRLLDPGNPKGGRKQFYSEAILHRIGSRENQLQLGFEEARPQ